MRRIKKGGKRIKLDEPTEEDDASRGFYEAPEGFMLPSGQGVCVQRIDSVEVEGQTVVLFHSEG
jgi:tRNA (guanine-N(7)-)-methyltransferase subunit TRM82